MWVGVGGPRGCSAMLRYCPGFSSASTLEVTWGERGGGREGREGGERGREGERGAGDVKVLPGVLVGGGGG